MVFVCSIVEMVHLTNDQPYARLKLFLIYRDYTLSFGLIFIFSDCDGGYICV